MSEGREQRLIKACDCKSCQMILGTFMEGGLTGAMRLGEVSASAGTDSRSPAAPSWPAPQVTGDLVPEKAQRVDGHYRTAEENVAQPADGGNHRSPSRARVLDDDQGESSASDSLAPVSPSSKRNSQHE